MLMIETVKVAFKLLVLYLGISSIAFGEQHIRVYIPEDVQAEYLALKSIPDITLETIISKKLARRDVMEVFLFESYLSKACECTITYVSGMTYKRALTEISRGSIDAFANPIWGVDKDLENTIVTAPVVELGDFEAALYTGQKELTKFNNPRDLLELSIITNPQWTVDHLTVTQLFEKVITTIGWESIVLMLSAGRADLTMAPLANTSGHSIEAFGKTLYLVPGVKVQLMDKRVLVLNNSFASLLPKLNKAISSAMDNGLIEQAYTSSGFYSKGLESWTPLNSYKK